MISSSFPTYITPASLIGVSTPAILSPVVSGDMFTDFSPRINSAMRMAEHTSRAALGAFVVLEGFAMTSTGLTLNIAAGIAFIDGEVVFTAGTYVVPASQSSLYIWAKQDGSSYIHTLTTTPPTTGKWVYIGFCTSGSSTISGITTDGVLYARGGSIWRSSTDAGAPSDAPPMPVHTITSGGTYFWNGAAHVRLFGEAQVPHWVKYTTGFADLQTAALTKTNTLVALPAKSIVHAAMLEVTSAFSGTGIATLALDLGITGTLTKYINALNGLAAGVASTGTFNAENRSASVNVTLRATAVGANLSALSAGSVDAYLLLSQAA